MNTLLNLASRFARRMGLAHSWFAGWNVGAATWWEALRVRMRGARR